VSSLILPRPSTHPDLYHGKYVASMFAETTRDLWYDPDDASTLYQDFAGSIPVTNEGQSVGLVMHASKRVLFRYTKSDLLNTDLWRGVGGPVASLNSDGSVRITRNTTTWYCGFGPRAGKITIPPGCAMRIKISARSFGNSYILSGEPYANWRDGSSVLHFPISNNSISSMDRVITNRTGGTIVSTEHPFPTGLGFYMSAPSSAGLPASDYIDVYDFEVTGYLPPAYQMTATSRPIYRRERSGYLDFDGVDDWLLTGMLDFSNTNKATILAGLRKLNSVGQFSHVVRLGTDQEGANGFYLAAPSISTQYNYSSYGSVQAFANTQDSSYAAPHSAVVTAYSDVSRPLVGMRVNGKLVSENQASQGSGMYSNRPVYIGRANNSPFRGRLSGLIVRGSLTDEFLLSHAERYLAHKTGVTL